MNVEEGCFGSIQFDSSDLTNKYRKPFIVTRLFLEYTYRKKIIQLTYWHELGNDGVVFESSKSNKICKLFKKIHSVTISLFDGLYSILLLSSLKIIATTNKNTYANL